MTTTFAVDKNSDLYIDDNGNLAIISGLQAVLQNCEHAVKTQLGEMIFFVNQGIPNFQTIWNGSPNVSQFRAALIQTITNVMDVVNVEALDISINENTISYTATISTIYGIGVVNG